MKDFYDIFMLLNSEDFDGRVLWEAVRETFERRGTSFEKEHPLFTEEFALDDNRNKQWEAFVRRTGLESTLRFNEIMDEISLFLYPIYKSLASEEEFFNRWKHESREWT